MHICTRRFSQLTRTAFSHPYPPTPSHGFFIRLRALKENHLEPDYAEHIFLNSQYNLLAIHLAGFSANLQTRKLRLMSRQPLQGYYPLEVQAAYVFDINNNEFRKSEFGHLICCLFGNIFVKYDCMPG